MCENSGLLYWKLLCYYLTFLCIYFPKLTTQAVHNKIGSQHESKLIHYLLEHKQYNPLIRPVSNLSNTIKVELGLALIQIINVEEKSQIMKTNVWLRLKWMDHQLRWEPSDFGDVDVARINPNKVWQPDIVLFNNADGNYEVSWDPNVLVDSTGGVLWIPPAIFISSCTIHVEYFPFDQQSCEMKFGSWTFDATQLTLGYYENKDFIDLSDYWKSGSWDLVDCPARMENITGTNQSPETQIIYTVIIKRKTLFFTINLIIPCVLISLLTVCVFYLPADAGEKMTLSISILLSLVVFLLLISKILPPTSSSIPLISKFLLFTFIMNIFTITITVIIINWNFRSPNTHTMPKYIRKLFIDILPKYLLMQRPNQTQNPLESSQTNYCLPKKPNQSNLTTCNTNINRKPDYIAYNRCADYQIKSPSFLRKSYQSLTHEFDSSKTFDKVFDSSIAKKPHHTQHALKITRTNCCTKLTNDPWINTRQISQANSIYNSPNLSLHNNNNNNNNNIENNNKSAKISSKNLINDSNNTGKTPNTEHGCSSSHSKYHSQENIALNKSTKNVNNQQPIPPSYEAAKNIPPIQISDRMRRAIKAIDFIAKHLEVEDNNKKTMQDWKYVAAVFDRIQLAIFTIVTVSGTMGILLKALSVYQDVNENDVIKKYSNISVV